ncbi:PH domain-containing protein [Goodfellowiella coeruleoviolacea]|uniref:PH domain-containing protein n=1 Tax=Goodfellowiella coeruleoviolacea TaxID=334858 RepID=A0AAE3GM11_9PSEU|nr:PH domain-containing protein [Goodfellowiella coeruleoviolacea]MCP2169962.1 PH domain-containing protein [Goodfellowiella coeruleoviolacea]
MSTSSTRPNADEKDPTTRPVGQVDGAEADHAEPTAPAVPSRMVFQIPRTALLAIAFLAFCASPVALGAPWLWLIYLVPLALVVWVVRTRTVVTADRLVIRTLFGRRELAWSDVRSLRLAERTWVRAVLGDDTELTLHGVRPRHLFLLSAITAGRIADPTAPNSTAPNPSAPSAAGAPAASDAPEATTRTDEADADTSADS